MRALGEMSGIATCDSGIMSGLGLCKWVILAEDPKANFKRRSPFYGTAFFDGTQADSLTHRSRGEGCCA